MDELLIAGLPYISAKRAAQEHRYSPDYIGQLIRAGKLSGQKVGRSWYVSKESLASFLASASAPAEKVPSAPAPLPAPSSAEEKKVVSANVKNVPISDAKKETLFPMREESFTEKPYELMKYLPDTDEMLPTLVSLPDASVPSAEDVFPAREAPMRKEESSSAMASAASFSASRSNYLLPAPAAYAASVGLALMLTLGSIGLISYRVSVNGEEGVSLTSFAFDFKPQVVSKNTASALEAFASRFAE